MLFQVPVHIFKVLTDLAAVIHINNLTALLVELNQGPGLFLVSTQAFPNGLRLVVGPLDQLVAAVIAKAFLPGRIRVNIKAFTATLAETPPGQAIKEAALSVRSLQAYHDK